MLIDWFTVGAQALNFLILVWLMKRFLYKPILHAIQAREKLIADELADANEKKSAAQKERDEFQVKNEQFDQKRTALLREATEEAQAQGQRLLVEARKAAADFHSKRMEMLRSEARNLSESIIRQIQQEVFAIARQTLKELATQSLEAGMVEVFVRRLRELDDQAKVCLGQAIKTESEPALLRSTFDLPVQQRAVIQNALNETFSAEIRLRFETAPDLISGIELSANGQKVAWSIADYLVSMEKGIELLLAKQVDEASKPPEATPVSEPEAAPVSEPEATKENKPEVSESETLPSKSALSPVSKPVPEPALKGVGNEG
jgi:F-type H+-transporting ATPase subunit b